MSFNKINNFKKREEEVNKFLKLRNELKLRDRVEKMGEYGREEALSKIFKPMTSATSKLEESLFKQFKELPGNIAQALPPPPPLPMVGPAPVLGAVGGEPIEGAEGGEEPEEEKKLLIEGEPELSKYLPEIHKNLKLKEFLNVKQKEEGSNEYKILLNNKPLAIDFKKDVITFEGEDYKKTPGLLKLLFSNDEPEIKGYNKLDEKNYFNILFNSGMLAVIDQKDNTAKLNQRIVQNEFFKKRMSAIKPLWKEEKKIIDYGLKEERKKEKEKEGKGNKKTIILSSDPEALVDRLTLLLGSAQAGNTGLKNEMVEICNELIRKKIISRKDRDELLYDI